MSNSINTVILLKYILYNLNTLLLYTVVLSGGVGGRGRLYTLLA